jgi:hypothetical protein
MIEAVSFWVGKPSTWGESEGVCPVIASSSKEVVKTFIGNALLKL